LDIFYCPSVSGNEVFLSEEESIHCVRVLRHAAGDMVEIIDGQGGHFKATVISANPKACRLEIASEINRKGNTAQNLHIAIAPTKNMDRFEWFVEKSVEIGVHEITPLLCRHSERKVLKTDRLERLIVSTMKQAIIPWHPVLNELTAFDVFINNHPGGSSGFYIAHCEEGEKTELSSVQVNNHANIVLIGPEGDFSEDEIRLALQHNYTPVSLGNNRLRTETAGVVACCSFILGLH
jgi:16S rRNA (uracil1498-N3)-methyltransferase